MWLAAVEQTQQDGHDLFVRGKGERADGRCASIGRLSVVDRCLRRLAHHLGYELREDRTVVAEEFVS